MADELDPAIAAKLNPPLILKISAEPKTPHAVTVTFAHAMTSAQVAALGLTGEGTIVYGNLDAAGVKRVAASSDVVRVSYRPSHTTT